MVRIFASRLPCRGLAVASIPARTLPRSAALLRSSLHLSHVRRSPQSAEPPSPRQRPRYVAYKPPEPATTGGPTATLAGDAEIVQPAPLKLNQDGQRRADTTKRALYLSTLLLILYYSGTYLYDHLPAEAKHPSCAEWSVKQRELWQEMHALIDDDELGIARWVNVLEIAERLLEKLDNEEGVIPVEDGVGTGLELWMQVDGEHRRLPRDLRNKSYAWKTGYLEALLACVEASEKLTGKVIDEATHQMFPIEALADLPTTSSTKAETQPAKQSTPATRRLQNVQPAAPSPEYYYTSLLSTPGLSTQQLFSAADQFATYLEHTHDLAGAETIYQALVDSSIIALPPLTSHIIDPQTSILQPSAPPAILSANLLQSLTWLARFWARQGETSKALPSLLSVLRARQSLPLVPTPTDKGFEAPAPPPSPLAQARTWLKTKLSEAPPLEEPSNSSGLEPPLRDPRALCEEAALMADVGEILYTSPLAHDRETGLRWTIRAVDLGAGVYGGLNVDRDRPVMEFCRGCVLGGLRNWGAMIEGFERAVRSEVEGRGEIKENEGEVRLVVEPRGGGWRNLLWAGRGNAGRVDEGQDLLEEVRKWDAEGKRFEKRREVVDGMLARDVLRWYQEDSRGQISWAEWLMQ